MKPSLMLAATLLPLGVGAAFGADPALTLDPLVVTAVRTPQSAAATLASVTLIERETIERQQARSLPDLLRGLTGVTLVENGGPGQSASLLLRGTDSDHLLLLVDGVRVGSATLGGASVQDLPLDAIDRIEIVRGPRSSLYGSEAIGGVIQIFTRRGGGPLRPRWSLGAGSLDTARLSGGLSGGGERAWFDLGASLEATEGLNACTGRAQPFAGCGVDQPDRDGYRNQSLSARWGLHLGEHATLDAHLLRTFSNNDFDGSAFAGNQSRNDYWVLGAETRWRPLDPWTLTLSVGHSLDRSRIYYDDPQQDGEEQFLDRFVTERDSLALRNDVSLAPEQLLTLGLDYRRDQVSGTVNYVEDSRTVHGLFGQYQARWGLADLVLSLRSDEDEQFGRYTTGNVALGYPLGKTSRVTLAWGNALKAPSFNDLYYPGFGNPDLDPEHSQSLELGLEGLLSFGPGHLAEWGLNLYETRIEDLIAFDPSAFTSANVARARIRGLDATASTRIGDWTFGANLSLLDPENRTSGVNAGNRLPRRPEQSLRLDLDRDLGRVSAGISLNWVGRRFDDLGNQTRLAAYSLVDLRADYALSPALRLQGRISNLFDEDYETAAFYNQPGRAFYLTLRYEPRN